MNTMKPFCEDCSSADTTAMLDLPVTFEHEKLYSSSPIIRSMEDEPCRKLDGRAHGNISNDWLVSLPEEIPCEAMNLLKENHLDFFETVVQMGTRQQDQDIGDAILIRDAQFELKAKLGKPVEPATADADFGIDHGGVNGLSELDISSQKKLSTSLPESWQHVKGRMKEVNTLQAHGTDHLTPSTAASPVRPLPDSIPPQALSPTASPPSSSPGPCEPASTPYITISLPSPCPVHEPASTSNSMPIANNSAPVTMSVQGNSPSDPILVGGTAGWISDEEFLRTWFTLIGIIAAAAIALSQGSGTQQKKFVRSLNLTAQIFFAMSFLFAVIGLLGIWILHKCGNARDIYQGSNSHRNIKISLVIAATGFVCMGIFMILAINIGRAFA